mmetsp:Transcript_4502/g.28638  ORF Transcript_4502/g.28638 Transcript_4502/m.28638 type:complete len:213 (-) Transcript_4502:1051-1689(-)
MIPRKNSEGVHWEPWAWQPKAKKSEQASTRKWNWPAKSTRGKTSIGLGSQSTSIESTRDTIGTSTIARTTTTTTRHPKPYRGTSSTSFTQISSKRTELPRTRWSLTRAIRTGTPAFCGSMPDLRTRTSLSALSTRIGNTAGNVASSPCSIAVSCSCTSTSNVRGTGGDPLEMDGFAFFGWKVIPSTHGTCSKMGKGFRQARGYNSAGTTSWK